MPHRSHSTPRRADSTAVLRRASKRKPSEVQQTRPRGRPPVISNERLLEVAREVFLELGIRATTLEVATRAGIAEGTIFLRFKSKEELFRSAMQFDPNQALAFVERLPSLAGQGELRATLEEFADEFLRIGRVAVPVMMMAWSNPDSELCGDRMGERGERLRRVIRAVTAFFVEERRIGRVGTQDPEVLARMLLGSLHHYCMSQVFAREPAALSPPEFARQVVLVLLAAALPSEPSQSAGRRRKTAEGRSK